ncbi:MAG: hypothetical protein KatS3mg044_0089 [Rhodothermaceae bacterium]|nr:MAG: hypothetical protein D6790_20365 [Caldilineae bacterium]GIV61223.1 MAG: hypothetical protein KatS3mg044_0089 [Rhodothermaceae bacterium]
MNKIFALIGIVLVAFIIGFVAIYFAMPFVAPERYEETRHRLDSLRVQRELAALNDSALTALRLEALGVVNDSIDQKLSRLDAGLNDLASRYARRLASLSDSLRQAHEALQRANRIEQDLQLRVQQLDERLKALEARQLEARDLSAVLPKLEPAELTPILAQLDLGLLEMLFAESTTRNRTKILQSLPSDRAARLVRFMVQRDSTSGATQPASNEAPPGTPPTNLTGASQG